MDNNEENNIIDNNEEVFDNAPAIEGDLDEELAPQVALKKLRDKLRVCESEKMEYLSGWQRAKADFINTKKQSEADRVAFASYAEIDLIQDLLPTLSHFENAMGNKAVWESVSKEWRTGIEHIYKELLGVLENKGLEVIAPHGLVFNPQEHEAVETVEVEDESQDHMVISVREKGFKLQGKVVKPARVSVGKYKN